MCLFSGNLGDVLEYDAAVVDALSLFPASDAALSKGTDVCCTFANC
jgi:hypothetical protein